MKKFKRAVFSFFAVLLFAVLGTVPIFAGTMETTGYDVNLTVNENNTFQVEITQKVIFTQPSHGIYIYIPYRGTVVRTVDGQQVTQEYRIAISDIEVPGYDFTEEKTNGILLLQIGDPDEYVNGAQTYRIRYTAELYDDGIDTSDEVYWDLIPSSHEGGISAGTFTISMPKSFPEENVFFYTGPEGSSHTGGVNFSVDGLDISGMLDQGLETGEGVTVKIALPEGYFSGEKTMLLPTVWMYLIMLAAPVLCVLLWLRFGKDARIVKTVEFYPPAGITSAEAGYIVDGCSDSKDLVSLIIYWANAGYLTIEQKDKKDFTLIWQKDLPQDAKTYELTMFNGLFSSGPQVQLSQLQGNFYATFSAAKTQLTSYFQDNKENRQFTKSSKAARVLGLLLMSVPFLTLGIMGPYITFQSADSSAVILILGILLILCFLPLVWVTDKWQSITAKQKWMGFFVPFIVGLGFGMLLLYLSATWYHLEEASIFAAVSSAVCLLMTALMKKRTKQSIAVMGKLLGFKEFIKTAQLAQLQTLVEENPRYFYNMLPYAYVFGLTEKWAKHFETLAVEPPSWYYNDTGWGIFNTMLFIHSFDSCSKSLTSTISVPPMPEDGSGIFGQSGGMNGTPGGNPGGGFSGGGFGGGGFGSW